MSRAIFSLVKTKKILPTLKLEKQILQKNSDNYDDLYKLKSIHSNVSVLVKMQRKQKNLISLC